MNKLKATTVTAVLVGLSLVSAGCGETRHCERDSTDTVVADSHCKKGERGYEWEDDFQDSGITTKGKTKSSSTPKPRARSTKR